jgi:hypothetical protein
VFVLARSVSPPVLTPSISLLLMLHYLLYRL